MTTTNIINREPSKRDYASPVQFRFKMSKLPLVEFFVQSANLPGISLGNATQVTPLYDIPLRNNPLPWTQHWISSKGLQVAPQETEVESYVVGGIKQDVKKDTFSGFKL